MLELGADFVVNHREPDCDKKVREITNRQGVDVVYEHIGKTVFPQEVALLKMGGRLYPLVRPPATSRQSTSDIFSSKDQICWGQRRERRQVWKE